MKNYRFQIILQRTEDGGYIAECPDFEGCFTQGDTYEEVIEMIKDAINICIQELREEGKEIDSTIPQKFSVDSVEIAA